MKRISKILTVITLFSIISVSIPTISMADLSDVTSGGAITITPENKEQQISYNYMEYRENTIHTYSKWERRNTDVKAGDIIELTPFIPYEQILFSKKIQIYNLDEENIISTDVDYSLEEDANGKKYIELIYENKALEIEMPNEDISLYYYTGVIPEIDIEGYAWYYSADGKGHVKAPTYFSQSSIGPGPSEKNAYQFGDRVELYKYIRQYDGFEFEDLTVSISYSDTQSGLLKTKSLDLEEGLFNNFVDTDLLGTKFEPFDYGTLTVNFNYRKIPETVEEPVDDSSDEPAEQAANDVNDEPSEQPGNDANDEPSEQPADDSGDEPSEQPDNDSSNDNTNKQTDSSSIDNGSSSQRHSSSGNRKDKNKDKDKNESTDPIIENVELITIEDEEVPLAAPGRDKAYVSGYPDQNFKPFSPITRAEMATVIARILNLAPSPSIRVALSDVETEHWAYNYIQASIQSGFFKDMNSGSFNPEQEMTRSDFASIISEYFNYAGIPQVDEPANYTDYNKDWNIAAINNAINSGVMKSFDDGRFGGNLYETRYNVITTMNRLTDRKPLKNAPVIYDDINESSLSMAIGKASINHTYTHDLNQNYHIMIKKLD